MIIFFPGPMCGLITVAPGAVSDASNDQLKSVQTPVMIVRGEQDTQLGENSSKKLTLIPSATKEFVIPKAKHPAYLDDPKMWHELLHGFLSKITCV